VVFVSYEDDTTGTKVVMRSDCAMLVVRSDGDTADECRDGDSERRA